MGFIPILRLLDHAASAIPTGLRIGDPIALWGDPTRGIRCVRWADGVRWTATGFTLDAVEDGSDWSGVEVFINDTIPALQVESLNKILRDTGFPRVETNWRIKTGTKLCLNLPGERVQLPVKAAATLAGGKVNGPVKVMKVTTGAVTVTAAPAPVVAPSTVVTARAALTSKPASAPAVRAPVSPVKPEPVSAPLKAARIAPIDDPTGVFTWPTTESGIWTEPHVRPELDMLWAMHQSGDRQVIALKGPPGTGKTSLAYDLAVRVGAPIAKIDGAGAITFADWVGATGATERNGATVTEFQPSGFLQAVRADGPMAGIPRIVLLDEINRSESSAANNALIPCLDHTGSLYVADARRAIPLDPAVMYVMTANIGSAHTGTVALDSALLDRVTHWQPMGYPTEVVEVGIVIGRTGLDETMARQLVRAAATIRDAASRGDLPEGIGPRRVLVAARKIKAGFAPRRACLSTWVESYSDEGGATSDAATVRSRVEAAFRA